MATRPSVDKPTLPEQILSDAGYSRSDFDLQPKGANGQSYGDPLPVYENWNDDNSICHKALIGPKWVTFYTISRCGMTDERSVKRENANDLKREVNARRHVPS